jgi:hypothetical protein
VAYTRTYTLDELVCLRRYDSAAKRLLAAFKKQGMTSLQELHAYARVLAERDAKRNREPFHETLSYLRGMPISLVNDGYLTLTADRQLLLGTPYKAHAPKNPQVVSASALLGALAEAITLKPTPRSRLSPLGV